MKNTTTAHGCGGGHPRAPLPAAPVAIVENAISVRRRRGAAMRRAPEVPVDEADDD